VEPDVEVKHRTISDSESTGEQMLKEKDLKNHLDADPDEAVEVPRTNRMRPKKSCRRIHRR
jgi:hypothetical protein